MADEADMVGIKTLMRTHIEVRNRSFMRRVHRDCFLGSDAVDFLVTHGFSDTREKAEDMGRRMMQRKLIRHVSDGQKFRDASHLYYRFAEDDDESASLAATNAGNGAGLFLGAGGCKWSFCPHTAHNSYIMDIGLAEEIERAVAGANIDARARAFAKLRARVKEQAEPSAPDWSLSQSTTVNKTVISVYQRKRPRGDFKNAKMTGMVGESAKSFIKGIMSFERRRQWEGMFEDGVVVEGVDLGEGYSTILTEPEPDAAAADSETVPGPPSTSPNAANAAAEQQNPSLPSPRGGAAAAQQVDPVTDFLQTVELAGIPEGMAIAFLNDPERQHALAHLRKQMMLSNPQDCMLCQSAFSSPADIRFCPCCAMVSCVSCVSKRVFEVVSRQVVSVCIHCCRESSRIRHPPQAVRNTHGLDASVRGKWWRPEELGMIDYSQSVTTGDVGASLMASALERSATTASSSAGGVGKSGTTSSGSRAKGGSEGATQRRDSKPLLPGLEQEMVAVDMQGSADGDGDGDGNGVGVLLGTGDEDDGALLLGAGSNDEEDGMFAEELLTQEMGDGVGREVDELDSHLPPVPDASAAASIAGIALRTGNASGSSSAGANNAAAPASASGAGGARCKTCGLVISRDMLAIEAHMESCRGKADKGAFAGSYSGGGGGGGGFLQSSLASQSGGGGSAATAALGGSLADINRFGTRIIYRTARPASRLFRPREVCALQDSFIDTETGTCYLYEISVRHCDVRGTPGYVTADVLVLMHVARVISPSVSEITIISQVDTRAGGGGGQWLLSLIADEPLAAPRTEDLVRELKASGNLQDILKREEGSEGGDRPKCNLDDFELLAVLGRGGFGKVMQVRHKTTSKVYAMKVLKKSELRRRRQVERTQTERTILAAVRHPFIVCLHFAFQNQQKLYMVMDFVQGGDFFTLMRKHKRLPEDWVRIYVGEIALALQHLHDMDVVYRDLKPENILLCGDGHLKLTDFGLSRFFESRPPAPEDMIGEDDVVTRSFCGTEQYMSPEMLLQQGHNFRMDWWCLGLLMHEMISARHPFHGPSHYDTLRNMVTKQPTIDPRLSSQAATVVRSLLIKSPRARLCCRQGVSELKTLPFFSSLDWQALLELRIDGPYKPNLNGTMDISSFETTFTREAAVDSIGDQTEKKDAAKTNAGGFMGLFGLGGGGGGGGGNDGKLNRSEDHDADSFRDFGFVKEEEVLAAATAGPGAVAGGFVPAAPIKRPVSPPPPPPPAQQP